MDSLFSVPLKDGIVTSVDLSRSLDDLSETIVQYGQNVLCVADTNSARYLPSGVNHLVLPPGETEKRWQSIDRILSAALSYGMARDGVFIAVGGGVILDMTAFAASIYMRGARCVLVPTTLLSAVDATLGGKTGIDYGGGKNLVGTFYPAERVVIAPQTLLSLPEREYRCGLGEVVKHAFLSSDRTLFGFLEREHDAVLARSEEAMTEMIRLSLGVKISYITRDPEERKGIRSALNLGHTFGHALEAIRGFSISHGEGVAWGVGRAFDAGVAIGITDPGYAAQARSLMDLYGFDSTRCIVSDEFPAFSLAIGKDKKKKGGEVRFVLMAGQGEPVLMPLPDDAVRKAVVENG